MCAKKKIKIEDIISLYEQGYTPIQISEVMQCHNSNILRRLNKAGFSTKRNYSKTRFSREGRYKIDLNFFKNIVTEAQAYFLGLMYSDGSVNDLQFYIKLKDEDILQKFKEVLKTEAPIRKAYYGDCYAYILQISSKEMCQDLINLGCFKNKTRTIRFPDIPKHLYHHFIRGFFDGDGCLQLQDKIYHCRIDFTSAAKEFLEDLRPIITEHAKTNGHLGKEHNYNVWHLNYSGHQVLQILDWLYKDSTYYLKRKYVKYKLLSSSKIG